MNSKFFCIRILGVVAAVGLGLLTFPQTPVLAAPAPVPKQDPVRPVDAKPKSLVATFGDWVLRCQSIANGAETRRVCEVAQQIGTRDLQRPVAELAFGRLKKADPLRITVVLPVNIVFPSLPTFSTDERLLAPVDLTWRKCLPGGCIADALLKDDVLQRLRTQLVAARIKWTDASGRHLTVAVSSYGLAQALDALSKE